MIHAKAMKAPGVCTTCGREKKRYGNQRICPVCKIRHNAELLVRKKEERKARFAALEVWAMENGIPGIAAKYKGKSR